MVLLDLVAKDDADFVGLSNSAVGIQQPLTEFIGSGASREDQVVAIFDLGKEQPVFHSRLLSFTLGKEWSQLSSHLRPQRDRSLGARESAICCRIFGSAQLAKAFVDWRNRMPCCFKRFAIQWY